MHRTSPTRRHLVRAAAVELESLLRALPSPIRDHAREVPVLFEGRPGADLIEQGIEPDTMGLFEGPSLRDPEGDGDALPPRITLFVDTIWDEAGGDPEAFRQEVRTTLLHELGHYLGLDEIDLEDRDLE